MNNKYKLKKLISIFLIFFILFVPLIKTNKALAVLPAVVPAIAKVGLAALATAGGIHFATDESAQQWASDIYNRAPDYIKQQMANWSLDRITVSAGLWSIVRSDLLNFARQEEYNGNFVEPGETFEIIDKNENILTKYVDACEVVNSTEGGTTGFWFKVLGGNLEGFNTNVTVAYIWVRSTNSRYIGGVHVYDWILKVSLGGQVIEDDLIIFDTTSKEQAKAMLLGQKFTVLCEGNRISASFMDYVYTKEMDYEIGISALKAEGYTPYIASTLPVFIDYRLINGEDYEIIQDYIDALEAYNLTLQNVAINLEALGVVDVASARNLDPEEVQTAAIAGSYNPPFEDVPGSETVPGDVPGTVNQWLQHIWNSITAVIQGVYSIPASIAREIERLFVPSANFFPNWFNQLQGAIIFPSFDDIFNFNYIEKDISWMVTIGGYSILPEITFQLIPDIILEQRNWIRTITGAWLVFVTGIFAVRKVSRLINS